MISVKHLNSFWLWVICFSKASKMISVKMLRAEQITTLTPESVISRFSIKTEKIYSEAKKAAEDEWKKKETDLIIQSKDVIEEVMFDIVDHLMASIVAYVDFIFHRPDGHPHDRLALI
ncbi:hypothetical protein L1987_76647 [Smallanthus sonchifolius]|uniref:Uncharacterized protein n=1 Tax=Smallanthus sonchifolius TaxID=185202 RepID=A0ACB8Z6T4_9ASTR|nr:hypothetical protein L1987_76647 [Smallanthus sonchifolius]